MKKRIRIALFTLLALFLAVSGFMSMNAKDGERTKRVLIKPKDANAEASLRAMTEVDIRHEFDGKFSAEVPEGALPRVMTLADVTDVVKLEILDSPAVCGDGILSPQEKCGETGLSQCDAGKVCMDCQCVNKNSALSEDRRCVPSKQRGYNVLQLNGGKPGDGRGVKIAILDTGAYTEHPDLDISACKDMTQKGFREGCEDTNGHGTVTSGVAGANGGADQQGLYGVAPGAELWMMKVCGQIYCYDDDIAEGILYAGRRGAQIVSISLGNKEETPLIKEAMDKFPEILFVAAAGNNGPQQDTMYYPAAYAGVVGVAANDVNKSTIRMSSRGINDGNDAVISDREVELTAGGYFIETTYRDGCYRSFHGTSLAAPAIAGLAAKVWQGDAGSTRQYMRTITQDITTSNGGGAGPGYDIASGYGLPVAP
jgi:subtilisin